MMSFTKNWFVEGLQEDYTCRWYVSVKEYQNNRTVIEVYKIFLLYLFAPKSEWHLRIEPIALAYRLLQCHAINRRALLTSEQKIQEKNLIYFSYNEKSNVILNIILGITCTIINKILKIIKMKSSKLISCTMKMYSKLSTWFFIHLWLFRLPKLHFISNNDRIPLLNMILTTLFLYLLMTQEQVWCQLELFTMEISR